MVEMAFERKVAIWKRLLKKRNSEFRPSKQGARGAVDHGIACRI
jgi:hypothetical protein